MAQTKTIRDRRLSADFRAGEFRCRCNRPECDAPPMAPGFIKLLQDLRDMWGRPLAISSGSRCHYWNALKSRDAPDTSQHMLGRAADIDLESPADVLKLASMAEKLGFGGIGLGVNMGDSFLHIDTGPAGRRWTY